MPITISITDRNQNSYSAYLSATSSQVWEIIKQLGRLDATDFKRITRGFAADYAVASSDKETTWIHNIDFDSKTLTVYHCRWPRNAASFEFSNFSTYTPETWTAEIENINRRNGTNGQPSTNESAGRGPDLKAFFHNIGVKTSITEAPRETSTARAVQKQLRPCDEILDEMWKGIQGNQTFHNPAYILLVLSLLPHDVLKTMEDQSIDLSVSYNEDNVDLKRWIAYYPKMPKWYIEMTDQQDAVNQTDKRQRAKKEMVAGEMNYPHWRREIESSGSRTELTQVFALLDATDDMLKMLIRDTKNDELQYILPMLIPMFVVSKEPSFQKDTRVDMVPWDKLYLEVEKSPDKKTDGGKNLDQILSDKKEIQAALTALGTIIQGLSAYEMIVQSQNEIYTSILEAKDEQWGIRHRKAGDSITLRFYQCSGRNIDIVFGNQEGNSASRKLGNELPIRGIKPERNLQKMEDIPIAPGGNTKATMEDSYTAPMSQYFPPNPSALYAPRSGRGPYQQDTSDCHDSHSSGRRNEPSGYDWGRQSSPMPAHYRHPSRTHESDNRHPVHGNEAHQETIQQQSSINEWETHESERWVERPGQPGYTGTQLGRAASHPPPPTTYYPRTQQLRANTYSPPLTTYDSRTQHLKANLHPSSYNLDAGYTVDGISDTSPKIRVQPPSTNEGPGQSEYLATHSGRINTYLPPPTTFDSRTQPGSTNTHLPPPTNYGPETQRSSGQQSGTNESNTYGSGPHVNARSDNLPTGHSVPETTSSTTPQLGSQQGQNSQQANTEVDPPYPILNSLDYSTDPVLVVLWQGGKPVATRTSKEGWKILGFLSGDKTLASLLTNPNNENISSFLSLLNSNNTRPEELEEDWTKFGWIYVIKLSNHEPVLAMYDCSRRTADFKHLLKGCGGLDEEKLPLLTLSSPFSSLVDHSAQALATRPGLNHRLDFGPASSSGPEPDRLGPMSVSESVAPVHKATNGSSQNKWSLW